MRITITLNGDAVRLTISLKKYRWSCTLKRY